MLATAAGSAVVAMLQRIALEYVRSGSRSQGPTATSAGGEEPYVVPSSSIASCSGEGGETSGLEPQYLEETTTVQTRLHALAAQLFKGHADEMFGRGSIKSDPRGKCDGHLRILCG